MGGINLIYKDKGKKEIWFATGGYSNKIFDNTKSHYNLKLILTEEINSNEINDFGNAFSNFEYKIDFGNASIVDYIPKQFIVNNELLFEFNWKNLCNFTLDYNNEIDICQLLNVIGYIYNTKYILDRVKSIIYIKIQK